MDICEVKLRKWLSRVIFKPLAKEVVFVQSFVKDSSNLQPFLWTANNLMSLLASKCASGETYERTMNLIYWINNNPALSLLLNSLNVFCEVIKDFAIGDSLELFRWNKHLLSSEKLTHSEVRSC